MELNTITQIRTVRDEIREKIKSADKNSFADTKFGGEQEYTFKGLLGGISALLTDISSLTKSPNRFVKLSTHGERSVILQHLTRINSYFDSPSNYIPQFEALKVLLRGYGIRNYSERQLVFEEEVSNVLKLKLKLEEEIKSISTLKSEIEAEEKDISEKLTSTKKLLEDIDEELDVVYKRQEKLSTQSDQLDSKIEEVDEIRTTAGEILDGIKESNSEVKSNEKLIAQFARQVEVRTNQFTKLEQNTEENNKKLEEYELERKKILEESKELIESARQALNYKTAEGISASFQSQYDKSNSKWIIRGWIAGAVLCLLGTLGLGFLVLSSESTDPLMVIIGRISLLPIPIIGAVFLCKPVY